MILLNISASPEDAGGRREREKREKLASPRGNIFKGSERTTEVSPASAASVFLLAATTEDAAGGEENEKEVGGRKENNLEEKCRRR